MRKMSRLTLKVKDDQQVEEALDAASLLGIRCVVQVCAGPTSLITQSPRKEINPPLPHTLAGTLASVLSSNL